MGFLHCLNAEFRSQKEFFVDHITSGFANWTRFVFRHPLAIIFFSLLFCLLCCVGFIPGIPSWIDGAENLYSLPYSTARDHRAVSESYFGDVLQRVNNVILTHKQEGKNVLTWDLLKEVNYIDRIIRGYEIDPVGSRKIVIPRNLQTTRTVAPSIFNFTAWRDFMASSGRLPTQTIYNESQYYTFEALCATTSKGVCSTLSVLRMQLDAWKPYMKNKGVEPEIFVFHGLAYNFQNEGFVPETVLGSFMKKSCVRTIPKTFATQIMAKDEYEDLGNGLVSATLECISTAEAFLLFYNEDDKPYYLERNLAWENVFLDVLKDNPTIGSFKLRCQAFRSRDDELKSNTSGSQDVVFVVFTFIILIFYSSSINFSCDLFRSRSYAALAGAGASMLGLIAGMGLMCLCGIAFVPTVLICPFLIMGIGVDDMFVVINSYSLTYMIHSPEERCSLALKDCGVSITITTLTNLVAFGVGSFSPYLSVKNFCIYSCASLFMGYIFVLTFFLAVLCLDAEREYTANACFSFGRKKRKNAKHNADVTRKTIVSPLHKEIDQKFKEISTYSLVTYKVRVSSDEKTTRSAFTPLPGESVDRFALSTVRDASSGGELALTPTLMASTTQKSIRNSTRNATTTNKTSLTRSSISSTESTLVSPLVLPPPSTDPPALTHAFLPVLSAGAAARDVTPLWEDDADAPPRRASPPATRGPGNTEISCLKESHVSITSKLNFINRNTSIEEFSLSKDDNESKETSASLSTPEISMLSKYELAKQAIFEEPRGSVGRKWRIFFLRYYGPILMYPVVKVGVLLFFVGFFAISVYGLTQLQQGLDLTELAPQNSYLRDYDGATARHFHTLDVPVDIIFTETAEWWTPEVQERIRALDTLFKERASIGLVINPFLTMLDDRELKHKLLSGKREIFEQTLYNQLNDAKGLYKAFEYDFVWQGRKLISWRFKVFPIVMNTSNERANFMIGIREDCASFRAATHPIPLSVIPYSYMMIFYESDLGNLHSVLLNMIVAAVAMLMVAFALLPDISVGIFVIVMITLIDIGLFGFMSFVGVKLNMVSSIAMVISIGFAVDYSAHMCHTFTHCEGSTRKLRVIESLVLMGNPVLHGAFSTFLGLLMLGFSQSYIFLVFFKMLTLVVIFGALHGLVLLPVVLSFIGPFSETSTAALKTTLPSQLPSIEDGPPPHGKPSQKPPSSSNPNDASSSKRKCFKTQFFLPTDLPAASPSLEDTPSAPSWPSQSGAPPSVGTTPFATPTTVYLNRSTRKSLHAASSHLSPSLHPVTPFTNDRQASASLALAISSTDKNLQEGTTATPLPLYVHHRHHGAFMFPLPAAPSLSSHTIQPPDSAMTPTAIRSLHTATASSILHHSPFLSKEVAVSHPVLTTYTFHKGRFYAPKKKHDKSFPVVLKSDGACSGEPYTSILSTPFMAPAIAQETKLTPLPQNHTTTESSSVVMSIKNTSASLRGNEKRFSDSFFPPKKERHMSDASSIQREDRYHKSEKWIQVVKHHKALAAISATRGAHQIPILPPGLMDRTANTLKHPSKGTIQAILSKEPERKTSSFDTQTSPRHPSNSILPPPAAKEFKINNRNDVVLPGKTSHRHYSKSKHGRKRHYSSSTHSSSHILDPIEQSRLRSSTQRKFSQTRKLSSNEEYCTNSSPPSSLLSPVHASPKNLSEEEKKMFIEFRDDFLPYALRSKQNQGVRKERV